MRLLALAVINASTKFEVPICTIYEDKKGDRKVERGGVVVRGSLKVTGNSIIRSVTSVN